MKVILYIDLCYVYNKMMIVYYSDAYSYRCGTSPVAILANNRSKFAETVWLHFYAQDKQYQTTSIEKSL